MNTEIVTLHEQEEYIRLCDLLKMTGAAATGGLAKLLILNGQITVNGSPCTQKGKKIRRGDQVQLQDTVFEVH